MIARAAVSIASLVAAALLLAVPAQAAEAENCESDPRPACYGIESVGTSLSTTQAGAHPDFTLDIAAKLNPLSPTNVFGLHDSYAASRSGRFNVPPGLIGDPNAIGAVQQCSTQELISYNEDGGGCPNGSQIGISTISAYELLSEFHEPVYMMQPPGGDVVARAGVIAGIFPTFIDFRVRSESDYGITAEITNAPAAAHLVKIESTFWGVPAAPAHDTERCTAAEAFKGGGCPNSPSRPPGSNETAFFTNPTRCGVPLSVGVNATSWVEPEFVPGREVTTPFPTITGCDRLPYGPVVEAVPTSHHTSAPTGLDMTLKHPAAGGVKVLEPSQTRFLRIDFPKGLVVNTGAADGLAVCSPAQVGFEERQASHCPDASKLAATELEIPVLERKLRGAIYLREPEPGKPYRVWVVADDLGLHVKFPGELELDKETGQVHSVIFGTPKTEGIPQAPLREMKLLFKSGFRAPLATPPSCDADPSTPERDPYYTHYEFTPWSGGPVAEGNTPMEITEGCDTGGFSPKLAAGSTDSKGGAFSPFSTTITRTDSEQNIAGLTFTLPQGLSASFAGIDHCEGQAAETGDCPPNSRIGKVVAAVGVGPAPLWVPQAGKRPTAIYLGGPYKGAPTSIVAVVPKQAGPFDFGDEVVRSAVFVDPTTAQATAKADPVPQIIEGTPLFYRTINVQLDRHNFALNPTSCAKKEAVATLSSTEGKTASPTASYAATGCSGLAFKPNVALRLFGGTHRGAHPKLRAIVRPGTVGANIGAFSIALPHSEFLDQAHIKTVCTRVQFRVNECPAGSVYGEVTAKTPILDEPLTGKIYLRSSDHTLPDMVAVLKGPTSIPIEIDSVGRIDSINGGIRSTFETVPDAPVSEIVATFPGGKKGLLVNSTELCDRTHRATAKFTGQNGKRVTLHPALKASCK
jgi:hypothetical protein